MNYKNYKEITSSYIDDIKANVSLLEHEQTKARILLLDNDNVNKTFSIGFKTPPEDSTGAPHIVEHSVLSGSRKYRTREPFMDMITSSLQTFLNAMTFQDKTIFPISSRNDKDFHQLMDVYLDAVFYPRMYEEEKIFLQEGWHREVDEGELIYNGVVYNEMKGVYGDPANQVFSLMREAIHPSGTYSHESGGNPKYIPDLSYEEFLNFHRRHYHPSNSYILLAGDMDFEKTLNYLHEDYLSHFDYQEPTSNIVHHQRFKQPKEMELTYSTSKEEYREDKAYFSIAWNFGKVKNSKELLLLAFLAELLVESDDGLIKNKLLEAGIGEDVYVEPSSSENLDFTLFVQHASPEKYEQFKTIVFDTLNDIVDNGIDKKMLEATLSKFEFNIRQSVGVAHQDLISYIQALNTWLYGGNPLEALDTSTPLKEMEEALDTDFYKKLIKDWFLDTTHRVDALIRPEINKQAKENEALREELQETLKNMTSEELKELQEKNEELVKFQITEDSEEAKATIPTLELEDVNPSITHIPRTETSIGDTKLIFNDQPTNGITYFNFAFNLNHLDLEELTYASILTTLLGKINTEDKSHMELTQAIYLNSGGVEFTTPIQIDRDGLEATPYLFVEMPILNHKIPDGLAVLEEIIHHSSFDNKERIINVLYLTKSMMEANLLMRGHSTILNRVASYSHKGKYLEEALNGMEIYFKISELLNQFDFEAFKSKAEAVYKKLFHRSQLTVNIIGDETIYDEYKSHVEKFLETLGTEVFTPCKIDFKIEQKNEAFTSSSPVQYVSKGYNYLLLNQDYSGDMAVLGNILSNDYLHDNIRAKGGAYGAGITMNRTGQMVTFSYRDPHLKNTLKVYDGCGDYIRHLEISERKLKDLIIGTMNTFDPHLSPSQRGALDFKRYLSGLSEEDISKKRQEALDTNLEKLKRYAPLLDEVMEKDFYAVIGNEETIEKNKELFNEIKPLKR